LDSSIIQGPFSVAPCQTLISRFATFASQFTATRARGTAAVSRAAEREAAELAECTFAPVLCSTLAAPTSGGSRQAVHRGELEQVHLPKWIGMTHSVKPG
jgi:hypothetical protein